MVKIAKKLNLMIIGIFVIFTISTGVFLYYINQPIFTHNYIEDDFEDKIPGIFPAGWLSAVHPLNVKVISDNGNNVMQIRDTGSDEITEVCRRFKKTSVGVIECRVKALDLQSGFFIHIPQRDTEYNPFDDIIIAFTNGNIYVIGGDNIIILDEDDSFWSFLRLTNNETWLINEWTLEDFDPIAEYEINEWISVKIVFDRNEFSLTINESSLGVFSYPKYNPPYFASLYFWTFIETSSFKFYVDDVKITLSQPVDYIHPANLFLLLLIPIFIIVIYITFQKRKQIYKGKSKQKKR